MPNKLLRPNVGIYVATADAFGYADITASGWRPTLAQLTDITKVFNVSPAITDAYTLNLTDSDTNNSLSVVDNAQVSVPTAYNYEVSLDGFRDAGTGTSYYNQFKTLLADAAVGTKYYIIKRTGKAHNAPFAVNDNISVFGVVTDYADDLVADGEMIRIGARFLQTGEVAVNTTVAEGTPGLGPWGTSNDSTARATGTKIQSNGNIVVYWVPSATVTDSDATFISAPKLSFLNATDSVNLTEAIAWDGYTLGAAESNKIDDKSIIDRTNAKTRGFAQFSGSLTLFRPASPTQSVLGSGSASSSTITLRSAALTVTTGAVGTSTLEITNANNGDKISVGMKVLNVAGVIGTSSDVVGTTATNVFTATTPANVANVKVGMKATVVAGGTVGATSTVTAVNTTSGAVTLLTALAGATSMNFSTDVFVTKVDKSGTNPIITLSTQHFGAVSTATFQADMDKLELGMKVTGTNVSANAFISSIDKANGTITVSAATGGTAIATNTVLSITTSYSLAYDLFKAATNSRPSGWLVTRVGKSAGSALVVNDTVSVFKFTADAVMDNTEGEDSMKFMVNFQPQGQVGVNVKLA